MDKRSRSIAPMVAVESVVEAAVAVDSVAVLSAAEVPVVAVDSEVAVELLVEAVASEVDVVAAVEVAAITAIVRATLLVNAPRAAGNSPLATKKIL